MLGEVVSYNGDSGRIVSDDKEYILLDSNISDNEKIEKGDKVKFVPEEESGFLIARFVKKA